MATTHCYLPDPRLQRDVVRYVILEGDLANYHAFPSNALHIDLEESSLLINGQVWAGDIFGVVPQRALSVEKLGGRILTVNFAPGGASRLFGLDVSGMADVYGLDKPLPHSGLTAIGDAARASTGKPRDIVRALDKSLLRCLPSRQPEGIAELAFEAIASDPSPSKLRIAEIASELGVSQRTLQRVYKRRYGVTMARYLRLRRFFATISAAAGRAPVWQHVPPKYRYADQSHFLRDARELTKTSAEALGKMREINSLFYPRGSYRRTRARSNPLLLPDWAEHFASIAGSEDFFPPELLDS